MPKPTRQLEALRDAEASVAAWNLRYGVGQAVDYQRHPELPPVGRKTRSPAFVVDNCRACVVLHKEQGIVDVACCRPVEASAVDELAALTGQSDPKHIVKQRLLGRLEAIARDLRMVIYKINRAYDVLAASQPLEFSLEAKQIGRDLEAVGRDVDGAAQSCQNLHLSADRRAIDDELS